MRVRTYFYYDLISDQWTDRLYVENKLHGINFRTLFFHACYYLNFSSVCSSSSDTSLPSMESSSNTGSSNSEPTPTSQVSIEMLLLFYFKFDLLNRMLPNYKRLKNYQAVGQNLFHLLLVNKIKILSKCRPSI